MPRVPNTRPTSIYWLFDVRPETLIEWPNGLPFYCGKTIKEVNARLTKHRTNARGYPNRLVSKRLNHCGEHVRIETMEIVPCDASWSERERFWIFTLRTLYPGGANVVDGGQGTPGLVQSSDHRAKISASLTGQKFSAERCAKISAANKGRKPTAEALAKLIVSRTGLRRSAETRAKMSAAQIAAHEARVLARSVT